MILADKIIKQRKKLGLSQEELAEKMGVSRQSVSKWESANSIPDLNKIIKLADLFGVTTDYLLRDHMEEIPDTTEEQDLIHISLEAATDYVDKKYTTSKRIARGVILCIYSVIPLFFSLALAEGNVSNLTENMAVIIGLLSLLFMVATAVSLFIRSNQYSSLFKSFEEQPFELSDGVATTFKQKLTDYQSTYHKGVSIAVAMYITSAAPLIVMALLNASHMVILMMLALLIAIAGLATYIIIPISTTYSAYQCVLGEGDYTEEEKQTTSKEEHLASFYWPLITAIYLGFSFWTMAWHITWVIWPVAALIYSALVGLLGLLSKEDAS